MKSDKTYLYWVRLENHKNIKTEGYIGITNNPTIRFYNHKKVASRGSNDTIHKAIRKYGDALIWEVLVIGGREYISNLEFLLRPELRIGWNIMIGGGDNSLMVGDKHPNYGKKLSEEQIEAIRKRSTGRVPSLETREKLRKALTGRVLSDETKQKMSKAKKGMISIFKGKKHKETSLRLSRITQANYVIVTPIGSFYSSSDAGKALNLCKSSVCRRCNNDSFPDFYKLDLIPRSLSGGNFGQL